ncbi:MAG: DUF362 domain-containing protein [Verrucomicrobia bacterium]|nr:DUF362 domain-containing protein [Verrucomicrobiota bacterium]
MSRGISRREFIRSTGALGLGLCALGGVGGCLGKKGSPDVESQGRTQRTGGLADKVAVVRGTDYGAATRKAVEALGGMGAVVKSGDVVVVKPNIAWISRPELGACTHPDVVAALVSMAREAGAKQVKVFDRPCHPAVSTYDTSGIKAAAQAAGADVIFMRDNGYIDLDVPRGKALTRWPVYRDFIEADVIINTPVAKVHGSTHVTLAIKNLMGVAGGNRGTWHSDIHQKLADWLSALPCDLTVIDATRPMMRSGPTGGSSHDLERRDLVVAARDIVAADAWVTKEVFAMDFDRVRFVKFADEMGLGRLDTAGRVVMLDA